MTPPNPARPSLGHGLSGAAAKAAPGPVRPASGKAGAPAPRPVAAPVAPVAPTAWPSPGTGIDYQDAGVVEALFTGAAAANLACPLRRGCAVELPSRGSLLMTGDLHDNGINLQRILKLAALHQAPDRHLVLHEIIHGRYKVNGRDMSVRTLARVAAIQLEYPGRVHVMLANHELAQLGGEGILKDGVSVVEAFDEGLEFIYDDRADAVRAAMLCYIRSLALAVRSPNGVLCSHSLPGPRRIHLFDEKVLERPLRDDDFRNGGAAYDMVWGRNHTQDLADVLAQAWGARVFVMGHQPAETGYEPAGANMLVLASDHEHGVALPLDLSKPYDLQALIGQIVPLASVVL